MIKGKEINFELAGNSSYQSSSYRGSTVGSNNRKESARGTMGREKRWKEAWYFQLDHPQIKSLSNIKLTAEERSVPAVTVVESVY